jgi:predicted amidohydrolase
MRTALIQLCSGINIAENISVASELIREAAREGAKLIATPEMTHLVQKDKAELLAAIYPEETDPALRAFRSLASALNINILLGSLAIKTGDKVSNRSFLIDAAGQIRARYDKIHLFDAQVSDTERYRESATYMAGDKPVLTHIDWVNIGLSICYDLRFSNLYRHYAQSGAQILAVPAAFTVPSGRAHWDVLLRARAIETGSFVLAPAQGGRHADGRLTYGHSMVVNPWGEIIACLAHDKPGHICVELDLSEVEKARRRIPAWSDTRIWTEA